MCKLWLWSHVKNEEVRLEQAQQNDVAEEIVRAANA